MLHRKFQRMYGSSCGEPAAKEPLTDSFSGQLLQAGVTDKLLPLQP